MNIKRKLIDLNELCEYVLEGVRCGWLNEQNYDAIIDVTSEMPIVETMHGHWIVEEDGNWRNVKCSVCGKDYACDYGMLQLQNFAYCPNCGADMRGKA